MALSEQDKAVCLGKVRDFLLVEFNGKFQQLYSVTVATCSLHPEQVNNEIRNMLTHVSRALSATSQAEFGRQMAKADGHIDRAKRDCLKLANLHILTELKRDSYFAHIRDGAVAMPLLQRLIEIEERLVTARIIEVEGIEDDLVERLESINADLQELRSDYANSLIVPGWNPRSLRAIGLRLRIAFNANWKGFVLGTITSLLSSYIWQYGFDPHHAIDFLLKLLGYS